MGNKKIQLLDSDIFYFCIPVKRIWNDGVHSYVMGWLKIKFIDSTQPAFNCSKLTIETLEQDKKYIQS